MIEATLTQLIVGCTLAQLTISCTVTQSCDTVPPNALINSDGTPVINSDGSYILTS